jgi:hypothetical protein
MKSLLLVAIPAVLLAAACGDDPGGPTSTDDGSGPTGSVPMRVVNGTLSGAVRVYVDGQAMSSTVDPGSASASVGIASGTHSVELRPVSGSAGFTRNVKFADGTPVLLVALDSAGRVTPSVLADTGAVVPSNATKLRVAHMASTAQSIEIWRTQPDYNTPIRVQFPFNYRDQSPYLQSTPGNWRILVSSPVRFGGNPPMPDTLAMSGVISVPAGSSRTVVIVDKQGGGISFVVVDP